MDRPTRVDFVCVVALEEERDALLEQLPNHRLVTPSHDDTRTYFECELPVISSDGTSRSFRLVVLPLLAMGRPRAAVAVSNAINRWRPRYVVMVGIAGGIAGQGVQLGDILIADQFVDYELQKVESTGPSPRLNVFRADPRLLIAAPNFRGDQWLSHIKHDRPQAGVPARHVGPIATGDKVVCDLKVLEPVRQAFPKLIGVEMEAGGAAAACFEASGAPGFFMVRGVSDLADGEKNSEAVKQWRGYACDVAAAYAVALLRSGPVPSTGAGESTLPPGFQHQLGLDSSTESAEPRLREDLNAGVRGGLFDGGLCSGYPTDPMPDRYYVAEAVGRVDRDDLRAALAEGLMSLGRRPIYASELLGHGPALCKISALIRGTSFGVFELTANQDLNVYLELGIAVGLGRPCVLLRKEGVPVATLAEGLDSYSMESYLDLRFEIGERVDSLLVDVTSVRPTTLPAPGSEATAVVIPGDVDVVDYGISVARVLAKSGLEAVFLRDPTGKLSRYLEREKIRHRILGTEARWRMDEAIKAIQSARVGIFRADGEAAPDAFLALGISIALNRPGILTQRVGRPIPANVAGLGSLAFHSFTELEQTLAARIRQRFQ